MQCPYSEDNLLHERQASTQGTVVDVHSSAHTLGAEWPWGLLLSDKHHVLFSSDKQRVTVGRSHDCDVVVDDPRISAVHFVIVLSLEVNAPPPGKLQEYHHRHRLFPHFTSSRSTFTPPWVMRGNSDSVVLNDNIVSNGELVCPGTSAVRVYLEDQSCNGTYVNDMVVGKGRRCQLLSGDDIGIVATPSKITREVWEAKESGVSTGSSSLVGVNEARLLADLPLCRSYIERFCFQAYPSPAATTVLNLPGLQENEENKEKEKQYQQAPQEPHKNNDNARPIHKLVKAPFRSIRWQQGNSIGSGASSVVYVGIDLDTGQMVALKVIRQAEYISLHNSNSYDKCEGFSLRCESKLVEPQPSSISPVNTSKNPHEIPPRRYCEVDESLRELCFLTHLAHQRIVRCLGVQKVPEGVCIILEYVAGGTLRDLIRNFGAFHERVLRLYTLQVLQGMQYLQSQGVVHGDLKSSNVLMSEKGNLKITDFGTSRFVRATYLVQSHDNQEQVEVNFQSQSTTKRLCGTPLYMSPEFIRTQESTFASDVWALGCMVYEMAVGVPPWEELHDLPPHSVVWKIGTRNEGPSVDVLRNRGASPALLSFLACTFNTDPHQRSLVAELLKHPFIAGQLCILSPPTVALFPATPPNWEQPADSPPLQILSRCKRPNSTGTGECVEERDEGSKDAPMMVIGWEKDEMQQQQPQQEEEQEQHVDSPLLSLDLETSRKTLVSQRDQNMTKTFSSCTCEIEDHKAFVYKLSREKILAGEVGGGVDVGHSPLDGMPPQRWRLGDSTSFLQKAKTMDNQEMDTNNGTSCDAARRDGGDIHVKSAILPASDGITAEFSGLTHIPKQ